MQYRLRTLLVVLAVLPPLLAYLWPRPPGPVPIVTVRPGETAEVDLIEIHTGPAFQQVLFWSRYPDGELHVREWRLFGAGSKRHLQIKHWGDTDCTCSWTENGVECRVRSPAYRERNSPGDPELQDRAQLPNPKRVPLWYWAGG